MSRFLAAVLLLPASSGARAADVTDRVTRRITMPAGTNVRIDATSAKRTITGSNRPDV